jgi:hypothetical protein
MVCARKRNDKDRHDQRTKRKTTMIYIRTQIGQEDDDEGLSR